jgi:S-adenosylmethionine synthetase
VSEPVSLRIDTHGTGLRNDRELSEILAREIDMTPKGIIERLRLRRPVYCDTAAYGHFGRSGDGFTWEALDLKEKLQAVAR